jgi:hypothetical protein
MDLRCAPRRWLARRGSPSFVERESHDNGTSVAEIARRGIMTQASTSPRIHDLAHQLLVYEAGADESSDTEMPPGFRVVEKLRRTLSRPIGIASFYSLLARARTLAQEQLPALGAVQIKPGGSLDGWRELGTEKQAKEASVALIAQLLGLLVIFVGEDLTLSLVNDAWPDFSVVDHGLLEKKL